MSETNQPISISSAAEPSSGQSQIGNPLQFIGKILDNAVKAGASDIHMRPMNHPLFRIDGALQKMEEYPQLTMGDMEAICQKIMGPKHLESLQNELQVDLSFGLRGVGRVRVNAYYQRGSIAMALRVIMSNVPTADQLGLPDGIQKFVHLERGLVILTGATGSGKSSTIASMINEVNRQYPKHIITIEDPIEFLFPEQRCIVSQRELGTDATTFAAAMKAALREDPDVILLGEMRDPETIEIALTAAETGHLVFSTLHAPATAETITRMVATFPPEGQPTIRAKISQNLCAVIAQRLIPHKSGEGRALACEILNVSARVRELILDPIKIKDIGDLVKKGATVEGMMSFDQHLYQLVKRGDISEETALQHASSATDLRLALDGFA